MGRILRPHGGFKWADNEAVSEIRGVVRDEIFDRLIAEGHTDPPRDAQVRKLARHDSEFEFGEIS